MGEHSDWGAMLCQHGEARPSSAALGEIHVPLCDKMQLCGICIPSSKAAALFSTQTFPSVSEGCLAGRGSRTSAGPGDAPEA